MRAHLKSGKFWLGLLSIIILVLGGLFFYVRSQIDEEKIRKLLVVKMEEALPGAAVTAGPVSYRLGFSLLFSLEDLQIKLKPNQTHSFPADLFQMEKVSVSIPFWAILFSSGTVELSGESPRFSFYQNAQSNNWASALGPAESSSTNKESSQAATEKKSLQDIPSFLRDTKFDVRLSDVFIKYNLQSSGDSGEVVLNRVILKDFGAQSVMGLEIESEIKTESQNQGKISADFLLVGDIDLTRFLEHEEFKVSLVSTLKQISVSSSPVNVTDAEFQIGATGQGLKKLSGPFRLKVGSFLQGTGELEKVGDLISVQGLALQLRLDDLKKNLTSDFKELFEAIDFKNSALKLSGNFALDSGEKKFSPNLKLATTGPIVYRTAPEVEIENLIQASWDESNLLTAKITSYLLGGEVQTQSITKLNPLALPGAIKDFPQTQLSIKGKKFTIDKDVLSRLLPADSEKRGSSKEMAPGESTAESNLNKKPKATEFPPTDIDIDIVNSRYLDFPLEINSQMKLSGNRLKSSQSSIKLGSGKLSSSYEMNFQKFGLNGNFSATITEMNLSAIDPFLPSFTSGVEGLFSGKASGPITVPNEGSISYDTDLNLNAKNGQIKGLDLGAILKDLISNIPLLNGKIKDDALVFDDRFETLKFVGNVTAQKAKIENFLFKGLKNPVEVQGEGVLGLDGEALSRLLVDIKDPAGKLGVLLKEETGQESLPLLLEGKGFSLRPNVSYSVKRLSKGAVKTQAKKQIQKQTEKFLDKNLKDGKIKDILKDKVNPGKLLKGLFN